MIGFLGRLFARRRLRPIVGALPRHIVKSFGRDDHATFGQARRAISDLKLPVSLEPYAYAAVCTFAEIAKAGFAMSADDYHRLRSELSDLFFVARADFEIGDLLTTPYSRHDPAPENVYASSGPPAH
jgi:hypothetical protein